MNSIDKLVAEKIMGWPNGRHPNADYIEAGATGKAWAFEPSTNIADAFQVAKHLSEMRAIYLRLEQMQVLGDWCAAFVPQSEAIVYQMREDAPMAICLAALKAVGIEAPR